MSALGLTLAVLLSLPPVTWYLAYLTLSEDRWWMFVANSVAHFLFVPVGLVVLAGLAFRHRGSLMVALVPAIIAVSLFGSAFVPVPVRAWWTSVTDGQARDPDPPTPAGNGTTSLSAHSFTMMTFNIHAENEDIERVSASILEADPDVVALQEVGSTIGQELRERLRSEYPHASFTFRSGWGGLAVLSRFPLSPGSGWFEPISQGNPQVLILDTPNGKVDLVHLHNASLPRNVREWPELIPRAIAEREAVSQSIAEYASRSSRPLIVVGDFNTTERSRAYAILRGPLSDAWREAGFGLGSTFPGGPRSPTPYDLRLPWWLIRIDYVFHSDAFVAERARIGQWDGDSDHRPVVVTLRWRAGG